MTRSTKGLCQGDFLALMTWVMPRMAQDGRKALLTQRYYLWPDMAAPGLWWPRT